jgi:hypothetical protein
VCVCKTSSVAGFIFGGNKTLVVTDASRTTSSVFSLHAHAHAPRPAAASRFYKSPFQQQQFYFDREHQTSPDGRRVLC